MSIQNDFQKEISSVTEKNYEYGNPFYESTDELIVLDSHICVTENFAKMMRDIQNIGKKQLTLELTVTLESIPISRKYFPK